MKYDVIVVGMGPSSAFFAYELIKLGKAKNILLIEEGKRVEDRNCPIEKTGQCIKCKPFCNITSGFSGAGAFSDGKLSLYNEEDDNIYIGGDLHEYIGITETKKLIDYTDSIYLDFGADKNLQGSEHKDKIKEIYNKAKKHNLNLISIPIRHLGTEKSHELYHKIELFLEENNVNMRFNTIVSDIIVENNEIKGVKVKDSKDIDSDVDLENIYADKVIIDDGRKEAK